MEQGDTDMSIGAGGTYTLNITSQPFTSDIARQETNGGNRSNESQTLVTTQPQSERGRKRRPPPTGTPFDDAVCERNWAQPLFGCKQSERHCCSLYCCWPYHKYMIATRLGETPFMPLIPCAVFALRIKIRTLFGIKGSLLKDFCVAQCCEPCSVCQMTAELDSIGL